MSVRDPAASALVTGSPPVAGDAGRRRFVDIPFAPSRCPFFYGWVIVGAATVGTVASIPGQTAGVSAFTDHLLAALKLTRFDLSSAYLAGTIASSLALPFAGYPLDRWGARVMVLIASAALALSLVFLSRCEAVCRTLGAIVGRSEVAGGLLELAVIAFGFFLIRFWGQGVLTLISRTMVAKWFSRRRGLAMGLSGMAATWSFAATPLLLTTLVDWYSWRGAWLVLAGLLGIGMTGIGFLFYRDNPEDCGLTMDGDTPAPACRAGTASRSEPEHSATLAEALRSYAFWVFTIAIALQGLIITGLTFHMESFGRSFGIAKETTFAVFLPMAFFSVTGNLLGGYLSDKIRLKPILWAQLAFLGFATAGLWWFGSAAGRWVFIAGMGFSGGLFGILLGVTWPRYFGRAHLGSVSSFSVSVLVFATAFGPLLFAASDRWVGDYSAAVLVCGLGVAACLGAALWVPPPAHEKRF